MNLNEQEHYKKQAIFWLIILSLFLFFIWQLENILLPFILGIAISYFLDPVVDKIEEYGFNRTLSTSIVLGSFALLFSALLLVLVPTLYTQLIGLYNALPNYISKLNDISYKYLGEFVPKDILTPDTINKINSSNLNGIAEKWGKGIFKTIWSSGQAIFSFFSVILITPVVAFYLLRDWDIMTEKLHNLLPKEHKADINRILKDIDITLSGFVRGQAVVCFLLGAFYSISLIIAGLNFALFIGMGAGLMAFIPYFGSIIGMGVALIVAWFQFGDISNLMIIAGIFLAGQMIEGNFLTPKLIGEKIGLHAVWVIFALMAGGELFGFLGVMIAVPISAIIGVLIRFSINKYLQSAYFHGKKTTTKAKVKSSPKNKAIKK